MVDFKRDDITLKELKAMIGTKIYVVENYNDYWDTKTDIMPYDTKKYGKLKIKKDKLEGFLISGLDEYAEAQIVEWTHGGYIPLESHDKDSLRKIFLTKEEALKFIEEN